MTTSLSGSSYPFVPFQQMNSVLHMRSNPKNVTEGDWSHSKFDPPTLEVWIYLNLICNTILLPLLLVTLLFSKHTKGRRPPLLVNMCVVWILSGVFSLLLFYDGTARSGDPLPSLALCTAQLSLLYGILPMWSVAVLALSYHVYIEVAGHVHHKKIPMPILVIAPYVAQISFTIAGIIAAITSKSQIRRSFFYCVLSGHPLSNAMSIFTFIICLGIVLLKIQLALIFYHRWKNLRDARRRVSRPPPPRQGQISVIRVLVFGLYVFAGMICNVLRLFRPYNVVPYLYCAIAGLVVFLVFGTQCHIVQAWAFWRWDMFRVCFRSSSSTPTHDPPLAPQDDVEPISPYADWRHTSLLSPRTMEGNTRPVTYHSSPMHHEPTPPILPPRVQLGRSFYTDQVGAEKRRSENEASYCP